MNMRNEQEENVLIKRYFYLYNLSYCCLYLIRAHVSVSHSFALVDIVYYFRTSSSSLTLIYNTRFFFVNVTVVIDCIKRFQNKHHRLNSFSLGQIHDELFFLIYHLNWRLWNELRELNSIFQSQASSIDQFICKSNWIFQICV